MLKVWGRKNSINVQKVMWAVGELGLPHERIDAGGSFGGLNESFAEVCPISYQAIQAADLSLFGGDSLVVR